MDNVSDFGHSAGAISIGHHLAATVNTSMMFHRALCMSGLGSTLLCLSLKSIRLSLMLLVDFLD